MASSTGSVSPAGEAFAMFPPSVPRFWICTAPIVAAASTSASACSTQSGERRISVYVVSAPRTRASPSTRMPRSSSSRHRSSIRSGIGVVSAAIWTSTSVPPAIGRWGAAASSAYACPRLVGEATGGSAGIAFGTRSGARGGVGAAPYRGQLDGLDDLRVARAAAEVAGDRLADGLLARVGAGGEERRGGQEHPGRAGAARRPARLEEGRLEGGEDGALRAGRGQPLDRAHRVAVRLAEGDEAADHRLAVEQHRAGAAFALATALLRAAQAEVLAQHVEEAPHAGRGDLEFDAVDDQLVAHALMPGGPGGSCPSRAARIRSGEAGRSWIQTPVASWMAATTAGAPPSTCPSARTGWMTQPTSSAETTERTATSPVSRSTSTSATAQAQPKAG